MCPNLFSEEVIYFHPKITFQPFPGTVLLDLDCDDLSGIANIVVDKFVAEDQLNPEHKGAVLKAILLKHKYVQGYWK